MPSQKTVANLGSTGPENDLVLGADSPMWVTSMAPITDDDGTGQRLLPSPLPPSGRADYALRLHDKQVAAPACAPTFPSHQFCNRLCSWTCPYYVAGRVHVMYCVSDSPCRGCVLLHRNSYFTQAPAAYLIHGHLAIMMSS